MSEQAQAGLIAAVILLAILSLFQLEILNQIKLMILYST